MKSAGWFEKWSRDPGYPTAAIGVNRSTSSNRVSNILSMGEGILDLMMIHGKIPGLVCGRHGHSLSSEISGT